MSDEAANSGGGAVRRIALGLLAVLLLVRIVGGGSPLIGGSGDRYEGKGDGPLPMARDALAPAWGEEGSPPPSPAARELDLKPEEVKVLKELEARRKSMETDREKLKETRERIKILKEEVAEDLEKLEGYRDQIQTALDREKQLRSKKMDHLVSVYSAMNPKKAAERIDRMKRATAVKLLSRMSGKVAGRILSFVDPDKANRISQDMTKMVEDIRR